MTVLINNKMIELDQFSSREFKRTISKGVSVVDFNTPWSAPCRAQERIIADLGKAYQGRATVATVNIDQNRELALNLEIQSIPTIIIFKDAIEVMRFVGLQTAETLNMAVKSILAA